MDSTGSTQVLDFSSRRVKLSVTQRLSKGPLAFRISGEENVHFINGPHHTDADIHAGLL